MATRKRANGHGSSSKSTSTEREQRELECTLSDAEFQARSDSMADAELAIEKLKETRKGVNGEIAGAAAERARLAHIIERRIEARMVECVWIEDFAKNVKRLIRQDTGAEVDTRPITAKERQAELALLPPVDEEARTLPPKAPRGKAANGGGGGVVVQLGGPPAAPAPKRRGRPPKAKPAADTSNTVHAH